MLRTLVSLTPLEYRLAKRAARNLGISLAELLRRSLRPLLPLEGKPPWMRHAGLVQSGNHRSSREIDELVYGQKD